MPHPQDIIDKTEVEIERVSQKDLDEREEGVPAYKEKVEYDEEDEERLKDELMKGYQRLKDERKAEGLEAKWDEKEAQYHGQMDDDANLEFSLNVPITMVKVDSLVRLALKAFLESDPKFTITPRPQMAQQDKWDVTVSAQSDYLDYKLDEEIDIESPLRKVLHQSALYDVGVLKVPYEYIKKQRRREEFFSGKPEVGEDGQIKIPGLESFVKQYPDAVEPGNEGHSEFKQLTEGKDVTFKSSFLEPVYDDPKPSFVDIRDFFVSKRCEGYQGLCDERLTIERQDYTWWELKKMEANGDFENVDECKNRINEAEAENKSDETEGQEDDYKTRPYEVIECNYWFNEKDDDNPDNETKLTAWIEVYSKTFLGAILYPYDRVESYYIPYYIKNKKAGFYKGGLAEDLTDSHLSQNAMLNFMLTETWQQLMTTPIIKQGSPIADQFLYKRWKPGVPIELPVGTLSLEQELRFLDKPNKAVAPQLMSLLLFLSKMDDDRTGISSLASGRESPIDPTAPAAKTAMLLEQSGINISDYVNCLLPSFNMTGEIILQLTHQMTKAGRPFKHRQLAGQVTGQQPFDTITRDQMVAKTNIQSRAAGFAFDKINEKRENLALFQILRGDPIVARNPDGVYSFAKTLIQSWSPLWKNKVDTILPSPEEFQKKQIEVAIQALQIYMQQLQQQAEVTGEAPPPQLQQYAQLATQMMAEAVTPTEEKKK